MKKDKKDKKKMKGIFQSREKEKTAHRVMHKRASEQANHPL